MLHHCTKPSSDLSAGTMHVQTAKIHRRPNLFRYFFTRLSKRYYNTFHLQVSFVVHAMMTCLPRCYETRPSVVQLLHLSLPSLAFAAASQHRQLTLNK